MTSSSASSAGQPLGHVLRGQAPWFLAVAAALAFVYWRVVPDMVNDWSVDENYSHGFLVPFLAGYFVWMERQRLAQAPVRPSLWGLGLVGLGLAQLVVGHLALEYMTMRSSLVVVLAGCILTLLGSGLLRLLALPVGYLLFMVPLPYLVYDAIAFPLKLFVTTVSTVLLKASGMVLLREGNIMHFPNLTLEVADACSGMRSLMSLAALGVAYAAISPLSPWRKVALVALTLPIAVVTNVLRVYITGLLAVKVSPTLAEGFFHEFTGVFVFATSLALFMVASHLLQGARR